MEHAEDQEILLEAGTNEVEITEFLLGQRSFGLNVIKIREFVPYITESVTKVPDSPESIEGVVLLRGKTIPLINLKKHLKIDEPNSARPVVIITEFNNLINGFVVDNINQVHRLSWDDIKPIDPLFVDYKANVTGSVHVDGIDILLLDLEDIIGKLFPEEMKDLRAFEDQKGNPSEEKKIIEKRKTMKFVIADDSAIIRDLIKQALTIAGYRDIFIFQNGAEALEFIKTKKVQADNEGKDISDFIDLVLSDIEMPKMDGLTLCNQIKHNLNLLQLPVIIFSSLINEQMASKCRSVGADSYITKPKMKEAVRIIDKLLFE